MPHILIRKNSILVNLLHIRALIKADTVLLFDVYGSNDSYTQSVFMYDLEGKLRQGSKAMGGLPYEMRALEAILISVTAALEAEMKVLQELVIQLLGELEDDINRDQLRQLLIYSKKLSTFEQKARLVRNAIDELLEADDDLADMYLTEKKQGYERPEEEHTEVEMLLESYHKICDEIVQISSNLVQSIRSTEEMYGSHSIFKQSSCSDMVNNLVSTLFSMPTAIPSCSWTSNSPSALSVLVPGPSLPACTV